MMCVLQVMNTVVLQKYKSTKFKAKIKVRCKIKLTTCQETFVTIFIIFHKTTLKKLKVKLTKNIKYTECIQRLF